MLHKTKDNGNSENACGTGVRAPRISDSSAGDRETGGQNKIITITAAMHAAFCFILYSKRNA